MHHKTCPLCESDQIFLHLSCTDHFLSKEVFNLNRCGDCGFVFTQDYPDENEAGRYYESEDYISHSDTSKGLSNKLYRIVRSLMLQRKSALVRKITGLKKGTLLDIGTGTGHFAAAMKKAGWQVNGIEINEKAREHSSTRFGLEIISPEQISTLASDSFDCITLWHVLEHFHDPLNYTSEIMRLLKPGGLCLIALPNCNSYDAEYYGKYWAAYDVPRHLWHFSTLSFGLFMKKTGGVAGDIRTLPLDVFYISILSERYKGTKLPFMTGILKGMYFSLLTVINRKRSSSIIYLMRKPTTFPHSS